MSAKLLNPLMSITRLKSLPGMARFCKLRLIILQSPGYSKNASVSYSRKVEIANACSEDFFIKLYANRIHNPLTTAYYPFRSILTPNIFVFSEHHNFV